MGEETKMPELLKISIGCLSTESIAIVLVFKKEVPLASRDCNAYLIAAVSLA